MPASAFRFKTVNPDFAEGFDRVKCHEKPTAGSRKTGSEVRFFRVSRVRGEARFAGKKFLKAFVCVSVSRPVEIDRENALDFRIIFRKLNLFPKFRVAHESSIQGDVRGLGTAEVVEL